MLLVFLWKVVVNVLLKYATMIAKGKNKKKKQKKTKTKKKEKKNKKQKTKNAENFSTKALAINIKLFAL